MAKNNNAEVWALLSDLHTLFKMLGAMPSPQVPLLAVPGIPLQDQSRDVCHMMILPKLGHHSGHIMMINRLLLRWVTEATDVLRLHGLSTSNGGGDDVGEGDDDEGESDDGNKQSRPAVNESLLAAERICRLIADILGILKLTTENSFEAHDVDENNPTFQTKETMDRGFVDLVESRSFLNVAEIILRLQQLSIEQSHASSQIAHAVELLKWMQHACSRCQN
ncbi:hypothetical protein BGX27_011006 [Mortierella sp. AM989]|nr:hypothetical protein BGX27_011006 [Mortierella sp. AM989]